jgi:UDP-N-acetylglucosamine:LPS N-acetylglucosamine transferase
MEIMDRPVRLLVAGGVTGGHLFPGIAAADALRDRIPDARVLFVSTGRPLERAALARAGYPLRVVPFGGIKGRGFGGAMRTLAGLPLALFRALRIVREFEPDIVLGLGGYASVPGVLAARPGGALAVLHEQNVRPGAANRLLARVAHRIYTAFPEVRGLPADRVRFVGNPVRAAIRDAAGAPLPEGPFAVLVVGGSQGARGINRAVAEALPALVRAGIRLMHQTGEADFSAMEAAFRAAGYAHLLAEVKERVRSAQYAALKAVNTELVGLYWDIGRMIAERQEKSGWGRSGCGKPVCGLAAGVSRSRGFSVQNLWYMRQFYLEYSGHEKLQPLVGEIAWAHNLVIMSKCKDPLEREFYIRMTRKFGWSKNVLIHQIDNQSYEKSLLGQTNFDQALTPELRPGQTGGEG